MKTIQYKYILLILFVTCINYLIAQPNRNYFGAGASWVKVTSSSSEQNALPENTVNGTGLNAEMMEASRFLGQATLGANSQDIKDVMEMGYEAWIEDQFERQPSLMLPKMQEIWNEIYTADPEAYGPYGLHFNYAWWENNMKGNDQLRQKMAYALSQILVVSVNSELIGFGEAVSSYYDIFVRNAFGNYRDILMEVTTHPAMGYYLSHLNNYKTDTLANIRPDENYAREVMQLFTIGLYELNQDGTRKLDASGAPIPTYTNKDIKEMAKIMTGLHGGAVLPCPDDPYPAECICWSDDNPSYCDTIPNTCCWWPTEPDFGYDIYLIDRTVPMAMSEENHEPGPKIMHDGTVIEIPGDGMAEIEAAIDYLFNHPNTGPFVAYRLIQRFVKSNPSPAYVSRVAAAFNNNGQNVRGDMKAVIKAILLDEEAIGTNYYEDPAAGKLREPFVRYAHLCKAFPTYSDKNRYWFNGFSLSAATKQHVLESPSVFNFYLPDYQPVGEITALGLVAPEFKLHNTATSVGYINSIYDGLGWALMYSWEGTYPDDPDNVYLDATYLENIADDSETLINELDILLTHGQLSDETRNVMRETLNQLYFNWDEEEEYRYWRVRLAIYLFMISPDYSCVK
ncbi:MAG: hypothetical protein UZ09_BCD002001724 [Bacteroidetes bacterium OLB9]|nr:MAG: hypothetical protein UZ09_BCD002001724 [Bacteroidetes bacterium OLB9]